MSDVNTVSEIVGKIDLPVHKGRNAGTQTNRMLPDWAAEEILGLGDKANDVQLQAVRYKYQMDRKSILGSIAKRRRAKK